MPKRTADSKAEACRILVRENPNLTAPELLTLIKDFGHSLTKETVHNAISMARKQVAEEAPAPHVPRAGTDGSAMERLIKAAKEVGLNEANRIIKAIVE